MKLIAIIAVLIAIAYLIWPIDLIPDFIPIIGWIDDLIILIGALIFFKRTVL